MKTPKIWISPRRSVEFGTSEQWVFAQPATRRRQPTARLTDAEYVYRAAIIAKYRLDLSAAAASAVPTAQPSIATTGR